MRPVHRRAQNARGEYADVEYVPAGARPVGDARQRPAPIAPVVSGGNVEPRTGR